MKVVASVNLSETIVLCTHSHKHDVAAFVSPNNIHVFRSLTMQLISKIKIDHVSIVSWHPSGRYIAVVSKSSVVVVYEIESGDVMVETEYPTEPNGKIIKLVWCNTASSSHPSSADRSPSYACLPLLTPPSTTNPFGGTPAEDLARGLFALESLGDTQLFVGFGGKDSMKQPSLWNEFFVGGSAMSTKNKLKQHGKIVLHNLSLLISQMNDITLPLPEPSVSSKILCVAIDHVSRSVLHTNALLSTYTPTETMESDEVQRLRETVVQLYGLCCVIPSLLRSPDFENISSDLQKCHNVISQVFSSVTTPKNSFSSSGPPEDTFLSESETCTIVGGDTKDSATLTVCGESINLTEFPHGPGCTSVVCYSEERNVCCACSSSAGSTKIHVIDCTEDE
eukprot:PhF_6_TR29339/c0_g1_i1/m.43070